jgi:hypothetical protein
LRNAAFAAALGPSVFALLVAPATAQVAGAWHVTGNVSGHGFVLDCHFEPLNAAFGGNCIETGGDNHVKAGKVHKLTQGSITGQQIHWAYPVSVMFMSFDIDFTGTLAGNGISGVVSASGRKGKFSAVRN